MAPTTKMIPCKFFATGFCRSGDSCGFLHEKKPGTQKHLKDVSSASAAIERLNINPTAATHLDERAKSTQVCVFFSKGSCNKGDKCRYVHPPAIAPPQQDHPETISQGPYLNEQDESPPQALSDSRAAIPCKFLSHPGGCRKDSCPYLHAVEDHEVEQSNSQDIEANEDEDQERDDDFTRDLSGASVNFNEFGDILKVSLPTDFSLACITGLEPGITAEAIVHILHDLGFPLNVDCVRILGRTALETKATVKVEDPLFAKELSARLKDQGSTLSATPMPVNALRTNCRKVYISWHKATRSAWVNFGNGDIANRVAQKFNEGRYKLLGQTVKSSEGQRSPGRRGRGAFSQNRVAWTIVLKDVPGGATSKDVEGAIRAPHDKPRHVELGSASFEASDADVSVDVRLHLEEHGPLESFYLAPNTKGKRAKATAWFQDEADARSARSLNNTSLSVLGKGKLTVSLVQSAKIKVSKAVYLASKSRINRESKTWKEQHLMFRVYPDAGQRFTTLKVEGSNAEDVVSASKTLNGILSGVVLKNGEDTVWGLSLNRNGGAYKKLKSIEKKHHVVIIRDKSKHQLQFHGPPERFQQVLHQVNDMLKEESTKSFEIDLNPNQFSWAMHGGFKSIEQVLGKSIAVLSPKKITINGTHQEYEAALAIIDGKRAVETSSLSDSSSGPEGLCPICFCEADSPIQTSCKHTYCLECFEACCKSAASTSRDNFQIKCQGNEGNCSTIFTLHELKDRLSSSVFETVLQSSFEEYIQRHPDAFHYCPTPDCGYIYRCTTAPGSKSSAYACPNCFEPLCTSCHARHGDYTCAEYKDIASGGVEALARLKKELNIKDCPKCTTPIEKTEGCNHMTCGGCKAHICWVCMAVFKTSESCYTHMSNEHGGIGIGM